MIKKWITCKSNIKLVIFWYFNYYEGVKEILKKTKWQHYIFYFFLVWYSFGVILVGFNILPTWLEWANSVFIITSGVLGSIYFLNLFGVMKGSLITGIIFIGSFLLEYVGSSYSVLFGSYHYTHYFAPNLFGVPIAIGFAWIMVIATSHAIVHSLRIPYRWIRAILGGLLAVVFDLVLDPVSYKVKEYWLWEESGFYYGIPASNFTGWFITAFCLLLVIDLFKAGKIDLLWQKRMIFLYSLMIMMFAFIALLNSLYIAGVLPLIVLAILLFLLKRGESYVKG